MPAPVKIPSVTRPLLRPAAGLSPCSRSNGLGFAGSGAEAAATVTKMTPEDLGAPVSAAGIDSCSPFHAHRAQGRRDAAPALGPPHNRRHGDAGRRLWGPYEPQSAFAISAYVAGGSDRVGRRDRVGERGEDEPSDAADRLLAGGKGGDRVFVEPAAEALYEKRITLGIRSGKGPVSHTVTDRLPEWAGCVHVRRDIVEHELANPGD